MAFKLGVIVLTAAAFGVGMFLALCSGTLHYESPNLASASKSLSLSSPSRKLLDIENEPNRVGDACEFNDLAVYQFPTSPLPNGIPTYTVQILNVCASGCSISNIHLTCGWFSSAVNVNANTFRRLSYDDCLVNDGQPIPYRGSVTFMYADSFPYHIHVSSLSC